ncbi:MAG: large repetitive protein, partial [Verrucomicrobiota bacterium]
MVGAFLLSTISPLQAAPEIVTQPTNQTVVAGQDAILTVGVSGSLSVSFQWRNGTNDIPDATNATLMLPQVQSSQAGSYSVLVSDETGVTNSAVAILTVQVPPGITGEPADRTVNQGQSTSLTVAVNGTSPFRFAWWFANAPLAGATNAMLNLSPAQGNQSGSYWVVVNNMAGAATSRVATVLVVVPPVIVTQPVALSVLPGATATFTVVATGTAPTFQWKFNGSPIAGATNSVLTLSGVTASQAGAYKVDVNNAAATVTSSQVNLTVYQAPVITTQPLDRVLNQGQTTNLSVTATADPTPSFQWWFNGQRLAGATSATLTLASAQGNQSGSYSVVLSNIAGTVTSRVATVLVVVPPVIVTQPVAQSVLPGATATFTVVATGTAPTFQWKFNGSPIADATNSVLTLSGVTASQAGAYKVDVNNAAAAVTSSQVNLTVYQAPVITAQPADRVLNQGQTTNLTVSATGIPNPAFQWWFNNQPLAGATSATLTLASAQGNQSGSYSVVLSNIAGTVTSRVATVLVVVPP